MTRQDPLFPFDFLIWMRARRLATQPFGPTETASR